jgi:hypothetical protein
MDIETNSAIADALTKISFDGLLPEPSSDEEYRRRHHFVVGFAIGVIAQQAVNDYAARLWKGRMTIDEFELAIKNAIVEKVKRVTLPPPPALEGLAFWDVT